MTKLIHFLSSKPNVSRRLTVLLVGFCLVSCVFVLRQIYMINKLSASRTSIRQKSQLHDLLKIPGYRGKIYDHDGNVLAWSEREVTVIWHVPQDYSPAENEWLLLAEKEIFTDALPHITKLTDHLGHDIILKRDLPFETSVIWDIITQQNDDIEGIVTFKRRIANPNLQDLLGSTAIDPQTHVEVGVSGLELEYDSRLRAGIFKIQTMDSPYRVATDDLTANGRDVTLNATYVF